MRTHATQSIVDLIVVLRCAVQVERSVLLDNVLGIYIGGGLGVKVTGCDIEGNAGPGVIVFGCRGLGSSQKHFFVEKFYYAKSLFQQPSRITPSYVSNDFRSHRIVSP